MSNETATDATSHELALSGDLTDAEHAEYWQRAYERMAARNGELSLTIIRMEEALRAIDAKIVELGLAAQRKANGHKHEKFAAVRQSMRLIVRSVLAEEPAA